MKTGNKSKPMEKVEKPVEGFSQEELEAMRERARELKSNKADGESDVLAKLSAMDGSDRIIGKRIHEIIKTVAPSLSPKTWYGMPAYASKEGKVVCFYQGAKRFKARYATLGFSDMANLDSGNMWPTSFAIKSLGPIEEEKLIELIKRAVKA